MYELYWGWGVIANYKLCLEELQSKAFLHADTKKTVFRYMFTNYLQRICNEAVIKCNFLVPVVFPRITALLRITILCLELAEKFDNRSKSITHLVSKFIF